MEAAAGASRGRDYLVPYVAMSAMIRIETAKIGSASNAYTRCSSMRGFSLARSTGPCSDIGLTLALPRRVYRFVRVLHQTLRAGDGARDVEAAIEAAEVLRGLERLLERGFREAQRRPQPFELAGVDRAPRYSR